MYHTSQNSELEGPHGNEHESYCLEAPCSLTERQQVHLKIRCLCTRLHGINIPEDSILTCKVEEGFEFSSWCFS